MDNIYPIHNGVVRADVSRNNMLIWYKYGNFRKISAFYELYVIFVLKYLLLGKRQMEQFSITRFKCVADILDKDPEMP